MQPNSWDRTLGGRRGAEARANPKKPPGTDREQRAAAHEHHHHRREAPPVGDPTGSPGDEGPSEGAGAGDQTDGRPFAIWKLLGGSRPISKGKVVPRATPTKANSRGEKKSERHPSSMTPALVRPAPSNHRGPVEPLQKRKASRLRSRPDQKALIDPVSPAGDDDERFGAKAVSAVSKPT